MAYDYNAFEKRRLEINNSKLPDEEKFRLLSALINESIAEGKQFVEELNRKSHERDAVIRALKEVGVYSDDNRNADDVLLVVVISSFLVPRRRYLANAYLFAIDIYSMTRKVQRWIAVDRRVIQMARPVDPNAHDRVIPHINSRCYIIAEPPIMYILEHPQPQISDIQMVTVI